MHECGGELAEAQKVVSKANVVGACDTLMNLLHKRNTKPPTDLISLAAFRIE